MNTPARLCARPCLLAVLVVGACAKPTEADCERLADHVIDLMVKDVGVEGMEDAIREEAEKERPKLVEECKGGTKAEVECLLEAQSREDMEKC
jgi:hypothetical protein